MLPRFFKPTVVVANHAESGESIRSSLGARRFDKVYSAFKPGAVYAILLRWPGEPVTIACMTEANQGKVHAVTLLGHDRDLTFSQSTDGLTVTPPGEQPCEHAWSLKISTKR